MDTPASQFRGGSAILKKDVEVLCREAMGELLGIAESERIFFTSGATESLNTVLCGLDYGKAGNSILVTQTEHNSVLRNFVISIPVELDEAAVIDGAGPLSLFFKIIMPLMKPTLVTCFILQFMTVWSDFLTPLYLSSKSKLFPMTMAVYQFFGKNKSYWNYIFADIVLTCIPVIIVYMIGQKYIVGGMTSGAVKE